MGGLQRGQNMKRLRKLFRIIFGRTAFVILALLLQIGFLVSLVLRVEDYAHIIYFISVLLSALVVITIFNEPMNSSFKLAWIVPVMVIPVFGVLLYIFVQIQPQVRFTAKRIRMRAEEMRPFLRQDPETMDNLRRQEPSEGRLIQYLQGCGGFPVYRNTFVKYFPLGEDMFASILEELKKAEHFIFLEFFIIDRGYMWDRILEILEEKVRQGVEVRVMYDGMCCLMQLPYHYPRTLERKGIRCKMFFPIKPTLSTQHNYRDHRKILVIDGHTAFTGGVNLADEYINRRVRFGHWKDTGILLKGTAAESFTMMFLQMWNVTEHGPGEYAPYRFPRSFVFPEGMEPTGFVAPYGDGPMDGEAEGKQVYLDILNRAERYVYIMTPYLILDDELENALCYGAKRGIDVRIIMPHIPDKKYAYLLARTYYPELIAAGVKIYEYTPGFVHAKVFVSDDVRGVVGTINLDFRSLYLHFECAAYLYKNKVLADIRRDYEETLKLCSLVTEEDCRQFSRAGQRAGRLLRLIAPLM